MGYGAPPDESGSNPIVEVNLRATEGDNFYFRANPEEQYIGLYHRHEDGTLMIGGGDGAEHEINPDEIIVRRVTYASIQETRELVSDVFYKKWFKDGTTLTDEELLSLQTTIRDGKKQSGRTEDEPLVFYKKDRNTLENADDLQGTAFDQLCEYIFANEIHDIENNFSIIQEEFPPAPGTSKIVIEYRMRFQHGDNQFDVIMASKLGNEFTDILNLSQLTKPKFGNKINPEKAREILDTNIFELLPNQTTRQDQINDFFSEFDNLVGPSPNFIDVDGDGVGEDIQNYEVDEQSRISYENQSNAFITRLDDQAEGSSINQGKTIESMRNRLNTYLGDVDNVIETLGDDRPEYQNKSDGFLKIRKPNQAIIIKAPGDYLLEFQKKDENGNPSYLTDGFTITMWVRFVSKTSQGTLFNFGNPLEDNGEGFRLETRTNLDSADNYKRWIRLAVRGEDGTLRDNHWGIEGRARRIGGESSPIGFYSDAVIHQLYPNIPTEDLNEWYFICATYNPNVLEVGDNQRFNKQYWLNHVNDIGEIVANSGLGAKCKVEIISRSDLLRARGYKIGDLIVTSTDVDDVPIIEEDRPRPPAFDSETEYEESEETDIDIDVG